MSLNQLKMTFCAAGLALMAAVGTGRLASGAAGEETKPAPAASRADRPSATEDLNALRLEIDALQKSLQAMRERVQALEDALSAGQGGTGSPAATIHGDRERIVVTSPQVRDVVVAQQYVCQIHSQRRLDIRTPANGALREIAVKEGQTVQEGDVMFKIDPLRYQARYDVELAKVRVAELEFNQIQKLFEQKVVSSDEVALHRASLERAQAEAKLAEAELQSTIVKAPFDGIVDQLHVQVGSLINERVNLATLSDNRTMRVDFNVPEVRYLEDQAGSGQTSVADSQIELILANGRPFPQTGKLGASEASFNTETGSIPFRADFENPDGLLRDGQTGTVLIHRTLAKAVVIPQRAVFEKLGKLYVYVVDQNDVVHQRAVFIQNEQKDFFVIKQGLDVNDRIVLEGFRQIRDGEKVEYERTP